MLLRDVRSDYSASRSPVGWKAYKVLRHHTDDGQSDVRSWLLSGCFHSAFQRCPPPADTNTRIIQVTDFIMGNVDTADVSRTDPHAPPVFIGHIGDQIILMLMSVHRLRSSGGMKGTCVSKPPSGNAPISMPVPPISEKTQFSMPEDETAHS